jgi:hypothetical protein
LTIEQYSKAKGLPLDFLAEIGVREDRGPYGPRVVIPYYDENREARVVRYRVALKGKKQFIWREGSAGKLCLYGLDRLPAARAAGRIVIVEGESDCHTLWLHGFCAIGVPGAPDGWKEKRDEKLFKEFGTIYVIDEKDEASRKLIAKLAKSAVRDRVRVVALEGAKDPSELHCGNTAEMFRERFEASLRAAVPIAPSGDAERAAIDALAEGDLAAFIARAEADPGFPFEPEAIAALNNLARQRPPDFQRLRARLKAEAKVRVSALDAAINAGAPNIGLGGGPAGRPIKYDEIKAWEESVDGGGLLTELSNAIGAYVVMDTHQRHAVALWVVFAHAHDLRDFAPLLIVASPQKRCGKTKLQETLARLVPKPQTTSSVTAALFPRLIEKHHPTLFIDEFDAMAHGDKEMVESLRGQLNSSFNKRSAVILKLVSIPGNGWEEREFSTWAPTCIAGIGTIPDTVEDRSIIIRLDRKLHNETVKRLRGKDGGDLAILARKIARFVSDNEYRLRHAEPSPPQALNDRQADGWDPLLAIADVVGGEWPKRARQTALALCHEDDVETVEHDVKLMLLMDIRDIFGRLFPDGHLAHKADRGGRPDEGPRLATKRLLEELHGLEEREWSTWGKARKPITDTSLAKLLRSYGIRSSTVRVLDDMGAPSTPKGYYLRSFADAFARYLHPSPISSRHTATNQEKSAENANSTDATNNSCGGPKNGGTASDSAYCGGVAAERWETADPAENVVRDGLL